MSTRRADMDEIVTPQHFSQNIQRRLHGSSEGVAEDSERGDEQTKGSEEQEEQEEGAAQEEEMR